MVHLLDSGLCKAYALRTMIYNPGFDETRTAAMPRAKVYLL
jgi:hypothetical protein